MPSDALILGLAGIGATLVAGSVVPLLLDAWRARRAESEQREAVISAARLVEAELADACAWLNSLIERRAWFASFAATAPSWDVWLAYRATLARPDSGITPDDWTRVNRAPNAVRLRATRLAALAKNDEPLEDPFIAELRGDLVAVNQAQTILQGVEPKLRSNPGTRLRARRAGSGRTP